MMTTIEIRNSSNERMFDVAIDDQRRLWIIVKCGKHYKIIEYDALMRQMNRLLRS